MPRPESPESARLEALDSYSILDTHPERGFDDLTELAAAICGVPISLVSFVAGDRQWFKAEKGLGVRETPRNVSFCAHTLVSQETLVVSDARQDPRFRDNALVTGSPGIRFYAGAPIIERNGHALGTVCVIDTEPHTLTPQQISALETLARQAVSFLEHRTIAMEKSELAEEAVRAWKLAEQSKEQLQLAVDSGDLAAWYYNPVRNIVGGDARMRSLFGIVLSEGPAEIWLAAVVEEDRERVAYEFAAGLAGSPYDTKYRVRVDGELRWLHARAKITPHPDGGVQMVGICEDVSREELLTNDLARTAERLAMAQDVSGATTFDWDLATNRVSWGRDCFGRAASELQYSTDVFRLLPESDKQSLRRVLDAAITSGKEYSHQFRAYWPDGSLHWMSTSGKPLRDEHHVVVAVVGVTLDITDRKLSEEALLQSEKLAAVGRLASTMSHEINNPLEAVTNLLFLVRSSPDLASKDREHLDMADRELARVSQVTAQSLRFHRTLLNPVPINALTLLEEVLELYGTRLAASAIEVDLKASGDAAFIGFEGDIRQVLNHLIGNAFDAMRKGGSLKLRARQGTEWHTSRQGTVITIADSGKGIEREVQARVFEAFYSTKGIGGTGLGLWISYRIVHKHKGRLAFRSKTGQSHGTVFRLWVPGEVASTARNPWAEQ